MLRLLRLPFIRSRASRIPEIPACGRRYADFSDTLLFLLVARYALRVAPARLRRSLAA